MADHTPIEWTDATWNIVTGCSLVSPGCTNCYAMKLAGTRLRDHPSRQGLTDDSKAGPVWNGQVRFNAQWLDQPLRWTKPRKIFVCAHGDLFHDGVSDDWLDQIFAVMALCPQHAFQILTKRPERMRDYLTQACGRIADRIIAMRRARGDRDMVLAPLAHVAPGSPWWPLPNVWLGVSVEDQARADERIPVLLDTPAAVRWISAEPLLGPVTIRDAMWAGEGDPAANLDASIDWVVAGGESGPGARPMHPDWARALRDLCAGAEVPFLFKQWGDYLPQDQTDASGLEWVAGHSDPRNYDWEPQGFASIRIGKKVAGRRLDGVLHDAYPEVRA
ncbi:phage Gp37/Gp68 family protein [Brevundimonas aurantiaca]|uniref:phage Gp37/Gp68 family protein n=1 Tax=Brevundimonas aurantiaca TaxID=74316 RepID=UPI00191A50A7|nr:phage Gp37/Gp68 family protein [Brevundimonas aurantiaca]